MRFEPEGEGKPFVVFTHRNGESWKAEKSVRADEPNYAKNDVVPLSGVPEDLIQYLYSENAFAAKVPEPTVEKVDTEGTFPTSPSRCFRRGTGDGRRARIRARAGTRTCWGRRGREIEDYNGVAGLYVWDLEGRFGYGSQARRGVLYGLDNKGAHHGGRLPQGGRGRS